MAYRSSWQGGVLTVTAPNSEQTQVKRTPINAGATSHDLAAFRDGDVARPGPIALADIDQPDVDLATFWPRSSNSANMMVSSTPLGIPIEESWKGCLPLGGVYHRLAPQLAG
jgi:hypothetical protein